MHGQSGSWLSEAAGANHRSIQHVRNLPRGPRMTMIGLRCSSLELRVSPYRKGAVTASVDDMSAGRSAESSDFLTNTV
jgi:hypothetical protein